VKGSEKGDETGLHTVEKGIERTVEEERRK
jgi:hypothetical protein